MSNQCLHCSQMRLKFLEFTNNYEDLFTAKQQELHCAQRIIKEISANNDQLTNKLHLHKLDYEARLTELLRANQEKNKIVDYYRQRQIKLIDKLSKNQREVFQLSKDHEDGLEDEKLLLNQSFKEKSRAEFLSLTPAKKITHNHSRDGINSSVNKQNNSFYKFQNESNLRGQGTLNQFRDKISLQVSQDKLNTANIKYKIALLKTIEVATIK